jgi:L-ascorbate metabolism protein UlaG (beta-lactamase superfamily)
MGSPFGSRAAGARLERIVASPRFVDGAFRNSVPRTPMMKGGSGLATVGDYLFGGQRRTPPAPLPSDDPRALWQRSPDSGLRATWLGHSTVLVEIDGVRVLTDPVWGERASPSRFAGPKRFQPVPVAVAALPPLDAVILSHDHYDHLDYPTICALAERDVPFYTSLGVGAHLEGWGIAPERIVELDWWETATLPRAELAITAAPSRHFSGRGLKRNSTLWSSFAVRGPRHSFFFSGDTGLTPEYADIATRLGPFDLVMLEVGAFHPSWGEIHLGPDNALEAHALLGGGSFLPVHWGTFNLAIHAWDEPAETLIERAPARGVQLVMPRLGAPVEPSRVERVDPWWRQVGARRDAEADAAARAVDEAPIAALPIGDPID